MANYAGQGVGLIHNILPAAEIVEQMISEAQAIMRRLPTMLA
jgi:NAD(P)H-dependent flavin oxidoreductase YrpB (nitropropane dioxygenase family)